MKYAMFLLLCCLALASAAPQLLTYPGYVGGLGLSPLGARTLVAGPTVINSPLTTGLYGGRFFGPGIYGTLY